MKRPILKRAPLALAVALVALQAQAGSQGYYRQPALHGDQVYLVAEGDLWRVPLQGGEAQRLTTHPSTEQMPAVSPDGRWIAFTASYDGGQEVYVMPVGGGTPKRLTWENAGQKVWGFTPQGEVLYTGLDGTPGSTLYAVDPVTVQRRQLPVAQASDAALSADGKTLYFTRGGLRSDNARHYRGGAMAQLWVLDLSGTGEARRFVAEGANDRRPLPYQAGGEQRVAFLSDRDGFNNLWSVKADGSDLRQHTRHQGWDIRHASIDGSRVVYALGADLYTLDLAQAGAPRKIELTLNGDFDQQRQRFIKRPQDFVTDFAFAPNGERVMLAARGHLAVQGLEPLRRAELQQPDDGRCKTGEFSSDSKSVFAICDFSGEHELWRFAANGLSKPQRITQDGAQVHTQRQELSVSPDGRYIAHTDKEGRLYLTDLKGPEGKPTTRTLAEDKRFAAISSIAWHPGSQALAFVEPLSSEDRSSLHLISLADGRDHLLSSDRYDSRSPRFSPDGKWLFFASDRFFRVANASGPWGDRNMGPYFDQRSSLFALSLQPGNRFPFAPKDELEADTKPDAKPETKPEGKAEAKSEEKGDAKADAKGDAKPDAKDGGKKEGKSKPLPVIVFEGLRERLYELPAGHGNFDALRTDGKRLYFLDGDRRGHALKSIALDNEGAGVETFAGDVRSYELSADGKKLMLVRNVGGQPEVLIVPGGAKLGNDLSKAQVRWTDWQIPVSPKAEWQQMFTDAWRMHRDHFYDVKMHGVDWEAVRKKYEPLVDRVTDRAELADLMQQMVSELGALHSQVAPGELRTAAPEPGVAGLGARFAKVADGFKVEHVYVSDPELPAEAGPLALAASNVHEGDVITQVNGRAASSVPHLFELLRGQAGRQVLLDVKKPDGKQVQSVVTPVDARRESGLRYNDWRYSRAQIVEKQGQSRIGYVHLRAMTADDIGDFVREFYAATEREGLIIDVRYNNGGNIDSWILEKLLRRAWAFWQPRSPRNADTYPNMQHVFRGHVVLLMNEDTYSDGETISEGFKRLGLGVTIGRQTSGAGVWLSDRNRLVDNGIMRAAETGQYALDGTQIVEGIGVTPEMLVDNLPRATFGGQDAQLETAIAVLKKQMAEQPMPVLTPKPVTGPFKH